MQKRDRTVEVLISLFLWYRKFLRLFEFAKRISQSNLFDLLFCRIFHFPGVSLFKSIRRIPVCDPPRMLLISLTRIYICSDSVYAHLFEFAKRISQSNLFDLLFCEANYFWIFTCNIYVFVRT